MFLCDLIKQLAGPSLGLSRSICSLWAPVSVVCKLVITQMPSCGLSCEVYGNDWLWIRRILCRALLRYAGMKCWGMPQIALGWTVDYASVCQQTMWHAANDNQILRDRPLCHAMKDSFLSSPDSLPFSFSLKWCSLPKRHSVFMQAKAVKSQWADSLQREIKNSDPKKVKEINR